MEMRLKPPFRTSKLVHEVTVGTERPEQNAFSETPRETNCASVRCRVDRQAKPSFRRVDIASIDLQELEAYSDRIVYQTLPWIKFIARTQYAEPVVAVLSRHDETLGYFTGLIVKKFGFRVLGSPFPGWSTPYMGFNLRSDVTRALAMEALSVFAFNDMKCHHVELMDRYMVPDDYQHLGFETSMFDSFELDLTLTEDELWRNMRQDCRESIRKAGRSGVVVEEALDMEFADDYYEQLKHVFAVKNSVPPFGVDRVRQLIAFMEPTGNLLMLRARNKEGTCIATSIRLAANRTVFAWGSASWRHFSRVRPNEMLQWYAIKYWKARGMRTFDLVGRGDYKLKYGSRPIVVPWVRKSKSPGIAFLRFAAEESFRAVQDTLGKLAHIVERFRKH
jgi:hypothetical protein